MKAVYKIQVVNNVVNQAGLHFKMERVSPTNNWLDKAREIGYFPKLSKYLREREEGLKDVAGGILAEVQAINEVGRKVVMKSRRPDFTSLPSSGETASLPPSKKKSPIQNTTKPKRPKA